ncbi:MAG TPA: hypothetical protein VHB47_10650 [Thermoanaerobaculia bacterium]|jgi:hypothetical protein|nr:hypothetical protein [Thermoanaerobaculia bacterium]
MEDPRGDQAYRRLRRVIEDAIRTFDQSASPSKVDTITFAAQRLSVAVEGDSQDDRELRSAIEHAIDTFNEKAAPWRVHTIIYPVIPGAVMVTVAKDDAQWDGERITPLFNSK